MPGKKILVLTSAHLCRNPRVVKEAAALGAAGYDVTVLTVSVQERFEALDRALMCGQPFKRETIDYAGPSLGRRLADLVQRGAAWAARTQCSARTGIPRISSFPTGGRVHSGSCAGPRISRCVTPPTRRPRPAAWRMPSPPPIIVPRRS